MRQDKDQWDLVWASPGIALRVLPELLRLQKSMLEGNVIQDVPTTFAFFDFTVKTMSGAPDRFHRVETKYYSMSEKLIDLVNDRVNDNFPAFFKDVAREYPMRRWEMKDFIEHAERSLFYSDDNPETAPQLSTTFETASSMLAKTRPREVKTRVQFEYPIKLRHRGDVYQMLDWKKILRKTGRDGGFLELQADGNRRMYLMGKVPGTKNLRSKIWAEDDTQYLLKDRRGNGIPKDWFIRSPEDRDFEQHLEGVPGAFFHRKFP